MILVLLGTQDKPFNRLLDKIESEILKGNIKQKVIAQIGSTKYHGKEIETFDFCSKKRIDDLIKKSDIIICHAGVGTIIECINNGKKLVVVPRQKKFNEHVNDHQIQITKEFAKKGYIIPVYDIEKLLKAIKKASGLNVRKYESNSEHFKNKLVKYIDM